MRRIFSSRALHILKLELTDWPYETHTHNFFELILVRQGSGMHHINDVSFPFHAGDIFLLTPEDHHYFDLNEQTNFTYIKFTEQVFQEKSAWQEQKWTDEIHQILYKPNAIPESIIKNKKESERIFQLAEMLFEEYVSPVSYSRQLTLELFGAIFVMVVRNLSVRYAPTVDDRQKEKFNKILAYIRQNVDKKEKVTIDSIAKAFNLSPNYVSAFLRKYTGCGLQKIITETRLKTAERLLKQSTLNINEIAEKVGFSDSSHMNKMFRKYNGSNPSDLR